METATDDTPVREIHCKSKNMTKELPEDWNLTFDMVSVMLQIQMNYSYESARFYWVHSR